MMQKTKVALAVLGAFSAAVSSSNALAGDAFASGISQDISVGSFIAVAGGEGRLGFVSMKFGARETVSDIGVIENHGTLKGVSQKIKVNSFINAGTKARIGGYYNNAK